MTSDPNGRKQRGAKESLDESEKAGLKLNILKTKLMVSSPINFMANRWKKSGNSDRFYFIFEKSLWMVIAAMKLKDTCSLEEKL